MGGSGHLHERLSQHASVSFSTPSTWKYSLVRASPGEPIFTQGRVNDFCSGAMKGPEGPQPRDGTAAAARGGATATVGETTPNNTAAEAAVGASSAGARFEPPPEGGAAGRNGGIACQRQGGEIQPPPEGGTAGRDEEIARPLRGNSELRIRAEIQAGEV